jgi:hypothetical protein
MSSALGAVLAWLASLVALVLTAAAGFTAACAGYPTYGRELDGVTSICAAAQQPVETRELRRAWSCAGQAEYRRDRVQAATHDLLLACPRHWRFTEDLQNGPPETRTGIQREAAEIARANGELPAKAASERTIAFFPKADRHVVVRRRPRSAPMRSSSETPQPAELEEQRGKSLRDDDRRPGRSPIATPRGAGSRS